MECDSSVVVITNDYRRGKWKYLDGESNASCEKQNICRTPVRDLDPVTVVNLPFSFATVKYPVPLSILSICMYLPQREVNLTSI